MSVTQDMNAISVAQTRILKCPGVTTDLSPATVGTTLYTITGDPVHVLYMFGLVSTVIGAGAAVPSLQLTANAAYGAGVAPIAAASASIANVAAGTIVGMTGVAATQLVIVGTLGIRNTGEANGLWGPAEYMLMVPGVIQIINTVSAVSGIIDWYLMYQPVSPRSHVAVR